MKLTMLPKSVRILNRLLYIERIEIRNIAKVHAQIQKVLPEGSNSGNVFFSLDVGKEDPNSTKSRPLSARPQYAI